MFSSYLKLGVRNLLKNKVPSAINLLGLVLSISIAITTFMFVDYYFSIDSFHENKDEIYLVQSVVERSGDEQTWGIVPGNSGIKLKDELSQVKHMSRMEFVRGIVRKGDQVFYERMVFAEPDYMRMLTFPIASGNENALEIKSNVIISEEMSIKYFGSSDPIGKEISLIVEGQKRLFTVGAVANKFNERASFSFSVLVPYENLEGWVKEDYSDWATFTNAVFVHLEKGTDPTIIGSTLEATLPIQNEANPDQALERYHIEPLTTASRNSYKVRSSMNNGNHPGGLIGGSIIAALLLLLTCINYTNIAVSSATGRLKEIALRKVIGGSRKELIKQFLVENVILCLLGLLLAVVVAHQVFLPAFNSAVPVTFPFVMAPRFWLFLVGILLLTSLGSGAYPAFYISKFQAVEIFRGKEKFGKSVFVKVMLTLQFKIALFLIISAVVFRDNEAYQRDIDWGYEKDQKIVFPVDNKEQFLTIADAMAKNPAIEMVAGSSNHIGRSTTSSKVNFDTETFDVRSMAVGPDYLQLMGVNLLAGKFFEKDRESDYEGSIIINQQFMEELGWNDWQQKEVEIDDQKLVVIGLVQDFHFYSFYNEIYPAYFRPVKEDEFKFLTAGIVAGKVNETEVFSKKLWSEKLPDKPYAAFFQNTVLDDFFIETSANTAVMRFLGLVAILLSCTGLYGLVSFNITKKRKEFSVRKIMGASTGSLFRQVNKSFIFVLLIAIVLASPLAYMFMGGMLENIYEYHLPMTARPFVVGFVILAVTVLITVASQMAKVFRANPVDALRDQ